MKLEVFRYLDDSLSDEPDEVFEDIAHFLPLGENLLQVDVSQHETVFISGYAKVRVTRTDEDVAAEQAEYEKAAKQRRDALLASSLAL